jgi:integrase
LAAVAGLRRGKTSAKDRPRIKAIDDATVDATLERLPPIVGDMVRLQALTGMRPAEVCQLRPGDIDRTSDTWAYRPTSHKTQHHDRERIVYIGPKAQEILTPYLLRAADSFCFSPRACLRHPPMSALW